MTIRPTRDDIHTPMLFQDSIGLDHPVETEMIVIIRCWDIPRNDVCFAAIIIRGKALFSDSEWRIGDNQINSLILNVCFSSLYTTHVVETDVLSDSRHGQR